MISPREVALARERMLANDGLPPERTHVVDRACEIRFIPQRSRWRDERHSRSLAQQWRSSRTRGSRLFVIHITPWHMRCPTAAQRVWRTIPLHPRMSQSKYGGG